MPEPCLGYRERRKAEKKIEGSRLPREKLHFCKEDHPVPVTLPGDEERGGRQGRYMGEKKPIEKKWSIVATRSRCYHN